MWRSIIYSGCSSVTSNTQNVIAHQKKKKWTIAFCYAQKLQMGYSSDPFGRRQRTSPSDLWTVCRGSSHFTNRTETHWRSVHRCVFTIVCSQVCLFTCCEKWCMCIVFYMRKYCLNHLTCCDRCSRGRSIRSTCQIRHTVYQSREGQFRKDFHKSLTITLLVWLYRHHLWICFSQVIQTRHSHV